MLIYITIVLIGTANISQIEMSLIITSSIRLQNPVSMKLKMPSIKGRGELSRHQSALHPESFSVDLNIEPSGRQ